MPPRRVVVDPVVEDPPADACPHCGSPLSPANLGELRFMRHSFFRCLPGRQPRVATLRCHTCSRVLVVYERGGRLGSKGSLALMRDQAAALAMIREREREDLAED